ncbi:MAG: hypothetical protein PHF00_08155, partial [Elusimicrobia bacterium]|nr:hypothetical protein [Elusimicrobiota bacterium]
ASGELNALQAWAVFTDTSVAASPSSGGAFNGTTPADSTDLIDADSRVGDGGGETARFVLAATDPGYKSMNDIPNSATDAAASKAHLWFKFHTPPSSTATAAQKLYITLTAMAP